MKITSTNIQVISLAFAKNQSEIPGFLVKCKIIPAKTTTDLQTCLSTITLHKAKLINRQRQNLILKKMLSIKYERAEH